MTDVKPPLSKKDILTMIADRTNDPDLSAIPYNEQQDIIANPDHPDRKRITARERTIRQGLSNLGFAENDLEQC